MSNVPWDRKQQSESYHRMRTDGDGGSLHALAQGTVSTALHVQTQIHGTGFNLPSGSQLAHMVFPDKPFDFEALCRHPGNVMPGTTYTLRIRSTNHLPGSQEIIWGFAGEFQTPGDLAA